MVDARPSSPAPRRRGAPALRLSHFARSTFALLLFAAAACEVADPLESIRQRQASGDYAGTIEPLRELIAENPEDGETSYLYGRALAMSGEIGAASWPLRQAMEDPEWRRNAAVLLARSALASHDFNVVVELTTEMLEEDPEDALALLFRAQAHAYWKKDQEAALADATRAMELEPERLEAYEPLILALLGLGRHDEASEKLAEAGRRLAETDSPGSRQAWHCSTSAIFASESGDPESARDVWRECLETHPGDATVVTNAVAYFDARQEWEVSLEIVRAAYAESSDRLFRTLLAGRLAHAGEVAEAESLLREATEAEDPRSAAGAWQDLAQFRHQMRESGAAAEALERAVEETRKFEDPGPLLLFQWADALVLSGQFDRALGVADEIDVAAQQQLIRGRVAQERGDAAAALREFDSALRLWPNNPWARYYAALAAERLGDFDRALEEYRYAVRIDVAATDARTRGARLLIADGQFQRAYQLLFLDVERVPLEPEGQMLSMYLMARAANPAQLQDALRNLAAREPAKLPEALARGAVGAAEIAGPASALGLLRNPPGIDYTDPATAPALRVRVRLAHAAEGVEEARTVVEAALAAAPDAAVFHEIHGLHLELAGVDAGAAGAAYARALELDPDNPGALMGLARLTLSEDPAEAAALFDRAVAADPTDPEPKLGVAGALLALGRSRDAASRLVALLAQHPFEAEAAQLLVALDLERGDPTPRTLDWARRAARFGATPEAYDQLGEIAGQLEQTELAERAVQFAQQLRDRAAEQTGPGEPAPGGSTGEPAAEAPGAEAPEAPTKG